MYRTLASRAYSGTQGRHIVISQEDVDKPEEGRFVVLDSQTFKSCLDRPRTDEGRKALDEFLQQLAVEHQQAKVSAARSADGAADAGGDGEKKKGQ